MGQIVNDDDWGDEPEFEEDEEDEDEEEETSQDEKAIEQRVLEIDTPRGGAFCVGQPLWMARPSLNPYPVHGSLVERAINDYLNEVAGSYRIWTGLNRLNPLTALPWFTLLPVLVVAVASPCTTGFSGPRYMLKLDPHRASPEGEPPWGILMPQCKPIEGHLYHPYWLYPEGVTDVC